MASAQQALHARVHDHDQRLLLLSSYPQHHYHLHVHVCVQCHIFVSSGTYQRRAVGILANVQLYKTLQLRATALDSGAGLQL